MRIAFLCKRHYTGHDVITDRFGRLYEIPRQLAELGHTLDVYCVDYYQNDNEGQWQHATSQGELTWHSKSLGQYKQRLLSYPFCLHKVLKTSKPDLIIAASDIPHVVIGSMIAKKLNTPFVADLYDNFESFGQAKIPFFIRGLKWAIQNSQQVITVSEPLKKFVMDSYSSNTSVIAIGNGVDIKAFVASDKRAAREKFGLPLDAKLIGTAGGLRKMKGVDDIFNAWPSLVAKDPSIHLVLAGAEDASLRIPEHPNIHFLGKVPYEDMPVLYSALDVGIVTLADNAFGRYCFPQKAYEMMACELPLIATNLGVMPDLFADAPQALYQEGNIESFVQAVLWQLGNYQCNTQTPNDWKKLIKRLETALLDLVVQNS